MTPEQSQQLAEQRKAARRARREGWRWYLRALLMLAIAAVALWRGGQVNGAIGAVLALLALLSWSLGRSLRRQAARMEEKLDLMAHMTSEELGELSG